METGNDRGGVEAAQAGFGADSAAEARAKRSRRIIGFIVLAALAIYYLVDPAGFTDTMGDIFASVPGVVRPTANPALKTLEVYFLDVGQGDCVFLRSPNGQTMLVDAGESQYFDVIDGFLEAQGVTKLDAVVETHPHSDHMGGMAKVIENYEIGVFYASPATNNTVSFENMLDALEKKDVETIALYADETPVIDWDKDVTVCVLWPLTGEDFRDDLNNASIVLRIAFEETSVLLPGDAETHSEDIMLEKFPAEYIRATVMKLGHHGSCTSTSKAFFDAAAPEAVVLCLGKNNDYGHPHKETRALLRKWGGPVFRTDKDGTIHFTLDGKSWFVDTQK